MDPTVLEEEVRDALRTVQQPELRRDLITLDSVRDIRISGRDVSSTFTLTTPACPLKDLIKEESEQAIRKLLPAVGRIDISFDAKVRADKRIQEKIHLPIKTIIAVGSGKGGVGRAGLPHCEPSALNVAEPLGSILAIRELAQTLAAAISVHQFRQNGKGKGA